MQPFVLNALNIRCGGGLQKVSSFLSTLSSLANEPDRCLVIARKGVPICDICAVAGLSRCEVTDTNLGRLWFELFCRNRLSKEAVCLNLGGLAMMRGAAYFVNISECAFSNLFYPEIDFWGYLGRAAKAKKRLIDAYRRFAVARSDYWIFQTEAIRRRAVGLCGFPRNRVCVVSPSPSHLVSPQRVDPSLAEGFDRALPNCFRFLFLNGAQPNKRIHCLPAIAQAMRSLGLRDFCFVSTMPERHSYTVSVEQGFEEFGGSAHFTNIGPVPAEAVSSLLHTTDAVCTFSRLESFSNNFVEAWKMQRSLVVTDADWARESCGTGALYVDPENAVDTAHTLAEIMADATLRSSLVREGTKRLAEFPSPEEKTRLYLECIDRAKELGPCPEKERRQIHWPRRGGRRWHPKRV